MSKSKVMEVWMNRFLVDEVDTPWRKGSSNQPRKPESNARSFYDSKQHHGRWFITSLTIISPERFTLQFQCVIAKFDLEISESPACQQLGSYHLGATSCNDSLKSSVTSEGKMQNDAKSFNWQDLAIQWIFNEEILQIFRSSKGCNTRWNCMRIGRSCDFWGNFSKKENSADQSLVSKSRKCLTCAGQTIQIQSTTKS